MLMELNTETTYTQVLTKCKAIFPDITLICIRMDFETALQHALKTIYFNVIQCAC